MLRPVIVLACLVALSHTAFAGPAPTRPGGPRLRAQDARIEKFIARGVQRSPTMRALVARIEASDVIVYVGANPMMKSHLSGALSFVTTAGGYRYVRAMINTDQVIDQMIATLAHEFQHVLEVVEDPSVVDDASLVKLYRRIGITNSEFRSSRWETLAAQATGQQVRRELLLARSSAVTDVASSDWSHDQM
jgi:hypothetical protein